MSQNFTSIENQPIFVGNKIKNSNLHIMRQYVSGNLTSIKILIENNEIIKYFSPKITYPS